MCQNGSFLASKLPQNWFHEKIWVTEKGINFYTVVLQSQKGTNWQKFKFRNENVSNLEIWLWNEIRCSKVDNFVGLAH